MEKINFELYLDKNEKELQNILKRHPTYSKGKITNEDRILIARTIYTLHHKFRWSFKKIAKGTGTTRQAGNYARVMKKGLEKFDMKIPGRPPINQVPKNFSDIVKKVAEENGCSKSEALKHIWQSVMDPKSERRADIKRMIQKQQAVEKAKEQTVDNIQLLLKALEKVMNKGQVYRLHRDILSIRIHDPDGILDGEIAEELVKKGWINIRE